MNRIRVSTGAPGLLLFLLAVPVTDAAASVPGIVMDDQSGKAILFDAETDTVTGSIPLGPSHLGIGDCLVLGDRGPAFGTDFDFRLWAIDLGTSPVSLAPPPNPIRISNPGEDLAMSADGRYLVVCDGSGTAPVSVVDVASRKEISTLALGTDCNSVDVCQDGSVLVSSTLQAVVRRLTLDASGNLSDTGESLAVRQPMNVYCAPGSAAGVVVEFSPANLRSFAVHGLARLDDRPLGIGAGLSAVLNPAGTMAYARSGSSVEAYSLDPLTGHLGATPAFEFPVQGARGFFGMDQMAIDPQGLKLYVTQPGSLNVYSAITGDLLATLTHPDIIAPSGVCLSPALDQDDDGLTDARESALGTDPTNPDSDGDGLLDGFEVRNGFNPGLPGDATLDPDGDGLDNLSEQSLRTDPLRADTDGDGLTDGAEVRTYVTDPLDPDSDGDGLQDGAEVSMYGTNPRNADTDGGGVRDGAEISRDDTNPLDGADDRPAGRAMVLDSTRQKGIVFDRDTHVVAGSVDVGFGSGTPGDCLILEDGSLGFATDFNSRLTAIDLTMSPPAPAPPPNPIAISNPGEDLALSPDGRFLLVCDGNGIVPISVVDVATRTEISTYSLGSDCDSVDMCADGSVLVTSYQRGSVRRLEMDATGHLSDTGELLPVPEAVNVYCAPDGRSGLVLSRSTSQGLRSFTLPSLTAVDSRPIPDQAISAALSPAGDTIYVRYGSVDEGGVQAYHYDQQTARLGADPFLAFPVAGTTRYFGMEQMAVDPAGRELYVSEMGALTIFDAATGERLASLMDPDIATPTGVCLRNPDRDHDGLGDNLERQLGTDPGNPDSDGDGLGDGFEVHNRLDPLSTGDGIQDPDGDGLDNLGEQAARTDPRNPDTDGDGLTDGEEVLVYRTNPRAQDSDNDGLGDEAEVRTYGSDPLNPDTDGGGVLDGNEVRFNGTNPLDPSDDHPSGPGMVLDDNLQQAIVFNPETDSVLAPVDLEDQSYPLSCVIPPDGREGFALDYNRRLWGVDLAASPPELLPQPNPTPLSTIGGDVAASPDGRFLVVCSGGYSSGDPISVVDRATRMEVSTFHLDGGCGAIDICDDGSVLVTSQYPGLLRRLTLDPAGHLVDTGESQTIPSFSGVYCAPRSGAAVVLNSNIPASVYSYRIPGLAPVDSHAIELPGPQGSTTLSSAAWRPEGSVATLYVRTGYPGGVSAYRFDLRTARFSHDPLFSFTVAQDFSPQDMAINQAGTELYLSEPSVVNIYSASDGIFVRSLHQAHISDAIAVCLPPAGDRDHDGLTDGEERRFGTDPDDPDSDADGLRDGFEVSNGFNPNAPGEEHQDPDGDGLDNLGEQAARTDPRNPDTDGDGLNDGQEVLVRGTDPRDQDTDDDGVLDGQDNCGRTVNPLQEDAVHPNGIGDACDDPDGDLVFDTTDNCPDAANPGQDDADHDGIGDACDDCPGDVRNDPDRDGVCFGVDNCPALSNPLQEDRDGDQVGDVCDICPAVANPGQGEAVACLAAREDGGACLEATIDLVPKQVTGALQLFHNPGGPPDTLRFDVLDSACASGDTFEFELNGVPLGSFGADPTNDCGCQPPVQSFPITDASLIASGWRVGSDNTMLVRKTGINAGFAWVRMTTQRGMATVSACLIDIDGGNCGEADLCAAGYVSEPDVEIRTFVDPLVGAEPAAAGAMISDSVLPEFLELAGIPDGAYVLCVRDDSSGPQPRQECAPITKQGERRMGINGAGCGRGPTAAIGGGGAFECQSPAGAPVTLDGSGSSDPDSTPGTNDDIVLFEWFEDFGAPSERSLGAGETLQITLPLGPHAITLRVTDSAGDLDTAEAVFSVVDTTAPQISLSVSPATLWPPAHQIVNVTATVGAVDRCGTASIVMVSLTSSEADDAPGGSDGQTLHDIQGASPGTADFQFALRAERAAAGAGRTYVVTYRAQDASGNPATATAQVFVPHDRSGSRDPIDLRVRQTSLGTVLDWTDAVGLTSYTVVRGEVGRIRETPDVIDLGPVVCVESQSPDRSTAGSEDPATPAPGNAFFYLVAFDDGAGPVFGSDTASKPLVPGSGGCP